MAGYDYVIVGAGSAGCVLANRLSENPNIKVALIEAGPSDNHPFLHMPKGVAKVMQNPALLWTFNTKPEAATAGRPEVWLRGRVLGGSSAINGMMYVRGNPQDYDGIAAQSSSTWNWESFRQAYTKIENHELGPAPWRGAAGPLHISMPEKKNSFTEAVLEAGRKMGWPVAGDINEPNDLAKIGYAPRTIYRGERVSSATAFLRRPVRSRPNLTIMCNEPVKSIILEGKRAIGVEIGKGDATKAVLATREVLLCGGAISTPAILERSGIGAPEVLERAGIKAVHALAGVGENLTEHRCLIMQWELKDPKLSENRDYAGLRLLGSTARYYLNKSGPMAAATYELGAWFRIAPSNPRPDVQMVIAPYSYNMARQRAVMETFPGMNIVVYGLRPTSRGKVHILSADPESAPQLEPNYAATAEDRTTMVGAVRTAREFVNQPSLNSIIARETLPGPQVQSDNEIISAFAELGNCGYHALGTCRMGSDDASVVDPDLKVRGIEGLRVVDASIFPTMPSGNPNGPVMAMAWIASGLIQKDQR